MSAKFSIDGSSGGAVKAIQDVSNAVAAIQKNAEGAVKSTKRLSEQARRIEESVNPLQRYNRQLADLKKLYDSGAISLQTMNAKQAQYRTGLERASQSGQKAFGPETIGNIGSMVKGLAATLGPLAMMKVGLDDIVAAVEKAKQVSVDARRGMGSLRQLANTDAEFQNLKGKAEALYGTGATDTLDQAAGAVFSLASAGQLDDKSFGMFAALSQKGVIDPATMARAVKNYQSAFGAVEAGDSKAIVQKGFAAAAFSPESVEALMATMPQVASVASTMGISDEEALAANAVMSASVGAAISSTQLRSFLTGTAKIEALEGKSIQERVAYIEAKKLDIPGLQKELGSIEGVGGFQLLQKNMPEVVRAAKDIERANTDPAALTRRMDFIDPESDAALSGQRIDAQNILKNRRAGAYQELREGVFEEKRQAARERANSSILARPGAAFDIGASHTTEWLSGWLTSAEGFIGNQTGALGGGLNGDQAKVLESLNKSADAAERTAREIEKISKRRPVRGRNE